MKTNTLYLSALPLVHVGNNPVIGFGMTEETLTLFPDRKLATEFHPDEVDQYLETFKSRALKYLVGPRITGYDFQKEPTPDGLWIVKVFQHVR